ncbi:MAG: hypothetical protein Q4F29_10380, partial [Lachnospiraceae bacterium]|nr:hypothetical protein [Lachnospiraceae bacterium]
MGRMIKAYSRIITKNIALFLAAGFLNLLFSENGWFPDDRLSRWSGFLSEMVIPLMLAYGAGQKGGEAAGQPERKNMGGAAGVLAAAGLVSMQPKAVILSAAALGAAAGYLTVWLYRRIEKKLPAGFEMIAANGTAAGIGLITAAASLKLRGVMLLRIGAVSDSGILAAAGAFLEGPFLFLSNLLIEPLKVLFLNNGIHHGVLIPLGMEQMKTAGRSALFLIESNPGPGLGVLLAFWAAGASLKHGSVVFSSAFPERRASGRSLLAQAAVEFFGGIHEVYFPYVLADLRLLAAVMAGGCSGTLCFSLTRAGLFGPASPGSMLSLLLLSPAQGIPGILLGVGVSAAVSFGISLLVLRMRKRPAA